MNAEQVATWRRIESAPLVGLAEDELFTRKLVFQNGWTHAFTQKCITEYRKFAFLAVSCGHPVSPPDAVDQVWHLHLTYTIPYWKTFCAEVLGRPLHHSPGKGGAAETEKFRDWYEQTLESYRSCFGDEPRDVWPDAARKCEEDRRTYQRVDTGRCWIVRKPVWSVASLRFLAAVLTMMFALGCASLGNPSPKWNLDGPAFLSIYAALLGGAILVCLSVRRAVRGPLQNGTIRPQLSVYEMAFLAGGARRVLQAMVVRLHQAGSIALDAKGKIVGTAELGEVLDPMEADIRQRVALKEKNWDELRETLRSSFGTIQDRLESMGLLVGGAGVSRVRIVSGLVMVPVLVLGTLRLWHGFVWARPIGFLAFLFVVGFGVTIWLMRRPFRTRSGDAELRQLQEAHGQERWSAGDSAGLLVGAQLALAVSLLGVSALRGTPLEKVESKLGPENGGGCGAGCGGTSCGGGGCGGGCGGCGG